jgi:hypothetical protein
MQQLVVEHGPDGRNFSISFFAFWAWLMGLDADGVAGNCGAKKVVDLSSLFAMLPP